jgi:HD superfamily phosphohydrolase
LFKYIIKKTKIKFQGEIYKLNEFINKEAFEFIAELINPSSETPDNFIFQIISNNLNGLDVDKIDYLYRDSFYLGTGIPFDINRILNHVKVINHQICFPEKISYDI